MCLLKMKLELNLVKRKSVQYIQACVFGHGDYRTNWENIVDEVSNKATVHDTRAPGRIDTNLN